jgi:LysM repeat protein
VIDPVASQAESKIETKVKKPRGRPKKIRPELVTDEQPQLSLNVLPEKEKPKGPGGGRGRKRKASNEIPISEHTSKVRKVEPKPEKVIQIIREYPKRESRQKVEYRDPTEVEKKSRRKRKTSSQPVISEDSAFSLTKRERLEAPVIMQISYIKPNNIAITQEPKVPKKRGRKPKSATQPVSTPHTEKRRPGSTILEVRTYLPSPIVSRLSFIEFKEKMLQELKKTS